MIIFITIEQGIENINLNKKSKLDKNQKKLPTEKELRLSFSIKNKKKIKNHSYKY